METLSHNLQTEEGQTGTGQITGVLICCSMAGRFSPPLSCIKGRKEEILAEALLWTMVLSPVKICHQYWLNKALINQ